uniref:Membrane protein n=1 Tax=Actinoplanes tsinanensis TaxID=2039464 RepID=A0A290YXR8_9ACTN|nr:membrane protein [Actinoplanes tsinanensis]
MSAVLGVLLAISLATAPAHAAVRSAAAVDVCRSAALSKARVSTWVRLEHRDGTYSRIRSELSVEVPEDWPLAKDLLLSEDSRRYVAAMSCLTRTDRGRQRRWSEWRSSRPTVASTKSGGVKVVDRTHSWVNVYRAHIDVGTWRVRAGAERWTVQLQAPSALNAARWDEIRVEPGAPGAESATPRPDEGRGATALVWHPQNHREKAAAPAVSVALKPSWQRSWAAQNDRLVAVALDRGGWLLWDATSAALLLYATVLYRRRSAPPTQAQERTLRNLSLWAKALVVLVALTSMDDVLIRYVQRRGDGLLLDEQIPRGNAFALAAVIVLFCVGRPRRRIWAAAAVLAVPTVAALPQWFELSPQRFVSDDEWAVTLAAQGVAACCMLALLGLGFVTAAWRLAVDGDLLPMSRRHPGHARVLRLRIAGPVILVCTAAVAICFALAQERNWQRATWLSDRSDPAYATGQWSDRVWEAVWSVANGQDWLSWQAWLLTGVAVLAVLRTWRAPASVSPLDDPADRLLFLAFFAIVAAASGGYFLGNEVLTGLWIPLSMLALYWVVVPFTHRSVLAQPFERSGRPLADSAGPGARTVLLAKARSYRETHAELRRLDQGLFGDVPPKRSDLEQELSDLHNWPTAGGSDRLPAKVSVVDGALALGPRDTWWANGSRCARLALVPAVPAALLLAWVWKVKGEAWHATLHEQFGLPDVLLLFVGEMVMFTSSAFVLGALWRHLPGQRGAAKALPVTLAFALPIGLDALVYRFTGESTANLALAVSAMLFVLTVTSIALDFDTFRGERRYWQSRLGLLLSIYQMRYYSLQAAYLIAQVVAMITIWEFFAEPDVVPKPSDSK